MKKDAKWTQKQIEKQWKMIFYSRKKDKSGDRYAILNGFGNFSEE